MSFYNLASVTQLSFFTNISNIVEYSFLISQYIVS